MNTCARIPAAKRRTPHLSHDYHASPRRHREVPCETADHDPSDRIGSLTNVQMEYDLFGGRCRPAIKSADQFKL